MEQRERVQDFYTGLLFLKSYIQFFLETCKEFH